MVSPGWRWRRSHRSPQRSYKGNGIFRPLFPCRVKQCNMFWKTAALNSCECLALSLGTLAKRNGPDVLLVPAGPTLVNIGAARWPSKPYSHAHAQYIGELSPHAQKLNSTGMNSSVLSCIKDNYSRMWSTFVKLRQPRPRGILSTASIQYAWHVCMYVCTLSIGDTSFQLPSLLLLVVQSHLSDYGVCT